MKAYLHNRKLGIKGFTLIEVMVVIAILGIIALIAIPRFAGVQERSRVNADASTAGQLIQIARVIEAHEDLDLGNLNGVSVEEAVGFPSEDQPTEWKYSDEVYISIPAPQSGEGNFSLRIHEGMLAVDFGDQTYIEKNGLQKGE